MKTKKECKEHEKRWRNYCVDKNLDDEWLERLNKLKAFQLVGICEGHIKRHVDAKSSYRNVNLILRDELMVSVVAKWPELKTEILKEAAEILENNATKTRLEIHHRLRARQGKIISQDALKISMLSNQSRDQDELGDEMRIWFEGCVERIEELDQIVYRWHQRIGT